MVILSYICTLLTYQYYLCYTGIKINIKYRLIGIFLLSFSPKFDMMIKIKAFRYENRYPRIIEHIPIPIITHILLNVLFLNVLFQIN